MSSQQKLLIDFPAQLAEEDQYSSEGLQIKKNVFCWQKLCKIWRKWYWSPIIIEEFEVVLFGKE